MRFVRNWIRNVILVILLAHFIELLLPENELKKYVKVVVGFFVIIVILTPLLKLTTGDLSGLQLDIVGSDRPSFAEIVDQGQKLRKNQQQEVQNDYRQRIAEQIEAVARLNSKLTEVEAKVELARDNNLQQILITGQKSESSPDQKERLQDIIATLYGLDRKQVKVKLKPEG